MAFTTEDDVRLKFHLIDTVLVPNALIAKSIDDAHERILPLLDPEVDTESPEPTLVTGETMLAGAYVLVSLSAHDAFVQKNVSIGGNRIAQSNRFQALRAAAEAAESLAWQLLAPYLADATERTIINVTESQPILGET